MANVTNLNVLQKRAIKGRKDRLTSTRAEIANGYGIVY
jgi:hypothetical protein